jgi:hypothetical protein
MNIQIITLIGTIIAAFVGAMATYINSRINARKRDQLDLVNKRLNEFYGPLFVATQAGRIAYESLLKKLGNESGFHFDEEDKVPSQKEIDEWYIWVKSVFMPLNDLSEKIIIEKAHLIVEEKMPDCLMKFVTHVAGFKAVIAKWGNGDYTEKHSLIAFPTELEDYITQSYSKLKGEQARLLKSL